MRKATNNPRTGYGLGIIGRWQFLAAVGVAMVALFVLSFGGLVVSGYQLNQRTSQLQREVQGLQAENERLEAEIHSLLGEEAVEKLAREQLGWTKAGETAIVVVPAKRDGRIGSDQVTTKPSEEVPNWRRWWDAFLGASPLP